MARARVLVGELDDLPPRGAEGTCWSLTDGSLAFVPCNPAHIPPDVHPSEFMFYTFQSGELEILDLLQNSGESG